MFITSSRGLLSADARVGEAGDEFINVEAMR
jgi:hypothetical protein